MKFDVILTNPPFQDTVNRKKTPHKLWIDFTKAELDRHLQDGGVLCQVSPASFASPSNDVLELMKEYQTLVLRFENEHHFPQVGSSFADYCIRKAPNDGAVTRVVKAGDAFPLSLDASLLYLPNDLCDHSMSIHNKVVFRSDDKLPVEWDYVTAHNIRRYDPDPSLVELRTDAHVYPVFHTNRSTWWSSIRQEWADSLKVMWTRSGYTKPFFDRGELGGTDMAYFVRVDTEDAGVALAANMNLDLMRYIYKTARWSGFGNERVFAALPQLPLDRLLTNEEMYDLFQLTSEEVDYVQESLVPRGRGARRA